MTTPTRRGLGARTALPLALAGCLVALTGCTRPADQPNTTPAPTVTITVTATNPAPSPTGTATPGPVSLQPRVGDVANLAYRSGAADPETQFDVPTAGYEVLYLCLNDGLTKRPVDGAGLHASGSGGPSDTKLVCDNAIHTITVDAATVRRTARAGTIRKISLTGDKQDVLGIDLAVRALG